MAAEHFTFDIFAACIAAKYLQLQEGGEEEVFESGDYIEGVEEVNIS